MNHKTIEPVDEIHACHPFHYKGIVHLHKQHCWAISTHNARGGILIPGIKFCPYCGENLPEPEREES